MKSILALFGLLAVTSSAFADGAPVMTCGGSSADGTQVVVSVDRTLHGAPNPDAYFVDTMVVSAHRADGTDLGPIASEIVDFDNAKSVDLVYKGATINLAMTYVRSDAIDRTGGEKRIYKGTLKISSQAAQSFNVLCAYMDHE